MIEVKEVFRSENGRPWDDPDHNSNLTVRGGSAFSIDEIDLFLSTRGVRPHATARYARHRRVLMEWRAANELDNDALLKLHHRIFRSMVDLTQIFAVIREYKDLRAIPLNMKQALFKETVAQRPEIPTHGANFLLEYYAGARFRAAGCIVEKDEPDFICSFMGIQFALAAKRFHIGKLKENIRSAVKQIEKSGRSGVIFLDLMKSSPFVGVDLEGTASEMMDLATHWMQENFYAPLKENWDKWGLHRKKIPCVSCIHFMWYYDTDLNQPCMTQQLFTFLPGFVGETTEIEYLTIQAVHQAVQSVRETLA